MEPVPKQILAVRNEIKLELENQAEKMKIYRCRTQPNNIILKIVLRIVFLWFNPKKNNQDRRSVSNKVVSV